MNEVLRQEKKYLLPLPEARRLGGQLSAVMKADIHNGGGVRVPHPVALF